MKRYFVLLWMLCVFCVACTKEGTVNKNTIIPTNLSVSGQAEEVTLQVVTDGIWRINLPSYNYWYTISPLSGSGNATISVRINENRDIVKRSENIVFSLNSERIEFALEQAAGETPKSYQPQEVRIHTKARIGKAANLLFLGDGFIQEDFSHGGAFDRAVNEAVKGWFDVEPYKSYREYFNIYKMCALSAERGASHLSRNVKKNTVFNVCYAGAHEGDSKMTVDESMVEEYIKRFTGISDVRNVDDLEVIVIVNDQRYGGTTTIWSKGPSIALCPMNRITRPPGGFVNLLVHEAGGHGFGHLADEYINDDGMIPDKEKEEMAKFQKYGLYKNVDMTADKSKVLWSDFIGLSGYNEVSTFEGGFYYAKGVWRPEFKSCMDANDLYFNAPSRRAIVQRIKEMAGETFSMIEFIQKDVQKTYPFTLADFKTKQTLQTGEPKRLAPPVVRIVPF